MIYAEKRIEASDEGYYNLRYLVYNGDIIGSYGVMFGPKEYDTIGGFQITPLPKDPDGDGFAYGASRDYHRLATEADIAGRKAHEAFLALPEEQQEAAWDTKSEPDYFSPTDECEYHDNKLCICDGSSLVEVVLGDKQAFEIAAMMANVENQVQNAA